MALLEELDSAPGADKFPEMYDKINEAIQTINDILGGGASGLSIRKASTGDFDFEFFNPQNVDHATEADRLTDGTTDFRIKIIALPTWNMASVASINVVHGLSLANILGVEVIIGNDAATLISSITSVDADDVDGSWTADGTNITLSRKSGASFDSGNYDGTALSRGWIKITHKV